MSCSRGGRVLPGGRQLGRIGVYGEKTRAFQRRIAFEIFGLSNKTAMVYRYLGSRASVEPHINDIQNKILFEIPDRAYDCNPVEIVVGMEPMQEAKADFSRWGLIDPTADETRFRIHSDDFAALGRKIIVGDVFEIPFYSTECDKSFWEVTDVDLRSEKERFFAIISATPLTDSRATREIRDDVSTEEPFKIAVDGFMEEMSNQVPAEVITFDEGPIEPEEVDYRDSTQASFLDDPTKTF